MASKSSQPFTAQHDADYSKQTLSMLHNLKQQGTLTDFTIKFKGNERDMIHCHGVLVAATCPYFASLFSAGMQESERRQVTLVDMMYNTYCG